MEGDTNNNSANKNFQDPAPLD